MERKKRPLGVYLDENLARALKIRAVVEGTTMSAITEKAIDRYIKEHLPGVLKEARERSLNIEPYFPNTQLSFKL